MYYVRHYTISQIKRYEKLFLMVVALIKTLITKCINCIVYKVFIVYQTMI